MKNLGNFIDEINEAMRSEEFDGKKKKDVAELNPKTDNTTAEKYAPVVPEIMGNNERRVQNRIDKEQPFFILGHAGWAKSSIVKRVAKRSGYTVLVVHLDKACKEDLDGIPTPVKDSKGRNRVEYLPMPWQDRIIDNPDEKFLLFFDEMNQADPEVMNALMPIVQDHKLCHRENIMNYLPCGAGNYKSENTATHELSVPLLSRFKPLILWEDNTEAAWKDTFEFYHQKYDSILGKEFIDKFWEYHTLFECPRELNEKLWDTYIRVKNKGLGNRPMYKAEYIAEEIAGEDENGLDSLLKKDIDSRDRKKFSREMGEIIHDWLVSDDNAEKEKEETNGRKRRAGKSNTALDEDTRNLIETGMKKGYIDGRLYGEEGILYAVSEENIYKLFDPNVANPEGIKQYIKHMNALGITFKYKTTKEAMEDKSRVSTAKMVDPLTIE